MLKDDWDNVTLELREWTIHHGIKMTGIPDKFSDDAGNAADYADWVASYMPEEVSCA